MQKIIRALGLAAAGGVFMYGSIAAGAEEFSAVSGIPAEPMTESEMAEVEGTGWRSIFSRQFSSGGFAFIKVSVNGNTQTASGSPPQSVTVSNGGVTVTASSGVSTSTVIITNP